MSLKCANNIKRIKAINEDQVGLNKQEKQIYLSSFSSNEDKYILFRIHILASTP